MNFKKLQKHTKSHHEALRESLQHPEEAYAYLQEALLAYQEDGEVSYLLRALRNVAEAQGGVAKLADKTQLNRQHLYRMLSHKGNPRLDTLGQLLKGLGFQLSLAPHRSFHLDNPGEQGAFL